MFEDELQRLIDEFTARHGMSPSTFGLWAMNDSRFVFDLRNGRICLSKTIRRVFAFMEEYDAKRGANRCLVSPPPLEAVRKRAASLTLVKSARTEN